MIVSTSLEANSLFCGVYLVSCLLGEVFRMWFQVSVFSFRLWVYFDFWTHQAWLRDFPLFSFWPLGLVVAQGLCPQITFGSWSGIFIQAWAVGVTSVCLSLLSHAVGVAGVPWGPMRHHFGFRPPLWPLMGSRPCLFPGLRTSKDNHFM